MESCRYESSSSAAERKLALGPEPTPPMAGHDEGGDAPGTDRYGNTDHGNCPGSAVVAERVGIASE
jgi:hypothetical protein